VLVVDDDPDILDALSEILEVEGYEVQRARNGREALQRIEQDMPDSVVTLIYRTAQEAIRNVVAHSHATNVSLTVTARAGVAALEVVDDGVGFTPETAAARVEEGHLGLRGLDGLAVASGGRLDVQSTPGEGTRLCLEVPFA